MIVSIVIYFPVIIVANETLKEGTLLEIIMVLSTMFLVVAVFYAFKMEVDAGYYECQHCHNKFIPSYFSAMIRPVLITSRYLKCPKCNKSSWAKKVMTKE